METQYPQFVRLPPPAIEPLAFTIAEFCTAHRISRSTYFKLRTAGKGPRVMPLGASIRISVEAAREWRQAREREAVAA
jgi:hypothetical protein